MVLTRYGGGFDPYPYIFLNLILSMVAALQAPVILMSQNRQVAQVQAESGTTAFRLLPVKADAEVASCQVASEPRRSQPVAG